MVDRPDGAGEKKNRCPGKRHDIGATFLENQSRHHTGEHREGDELVECQRDRNSAGVHMVSRLWHRVGMQHSQISTSAMPVVLALALAIGACSDRRDPEPANRSEEIKPTVPADSASSLPEPALDRAQLLVLFLDASSAAIVRS